MNEEKRRKAEMLLSEIGEIDDSLLEEALSYRKRRRINTRVRATVAAAVVLVFCLAVAAPMIEKMSGGMSGGVTDGAENDTERNPGDMNENAPGGTVGADCLKGFDSIFATLSEHELGEYRYVTNPDELPYLDGHVYIVWNYEGDSRYFVSSPLSDSKFETIKHALGQGEKTGDVSPQLTANVWVLLGDGRVISPYLCGSQGNVSEKIFDYEVEIIPDQRLIDRIQSLIG